MGTRRKMHYKKQKQKLTLKKYSKLNHPGIAGKIIKMYSLIKEKKC